MQDDTLSFLVYFEIYGKKMKTEVKAVNKQHVIDIIKSNLIFHKIEYIPKYIKKDEDFVNILQELMGMGGQSYADRWHSKMDSYKEIG